MSNALKYLNGISYSKVYCSRCNCDCTISRNTMILSKTKFHSTKRYLTANNGSVVILIKELLKKQCLKKKITVVFTVMFYNVFLRSKVDHFLLFKYGKQQLYRTPRLLGDEQNT